MNEKLEIGISLKSQFKIFRELWIKHGVESYRFDKFWIALNVVYKLLGITKYFLN